MTTGKRTLHCSRRTFAAGIAASTFVAGVSARPATAQDATAETAQFGIVGAWRIESTLAGVEESRATRLIFAGDGTMSGGVPITMPGFPGMGPVIFVSGVSGAWRAEAPAGAAFTFDMQISDEMGSVLGFFTLRGLVELAGDGQTFEGTYTTSVTDPAGMTLPLGPGTIAGTRIVVEAMELPESGTPTT